MYTLKKLTKKNIQPVPNRVLFLLSLTFPFLPLALECIKSAAEQSCRSHKKNNKNNNLENYFTQDQGCKSRGQGLGNSVLHVPHQLYKAWTGEGEEEDLLQIIDVICPNMMHHHNQIEKVFSILLTDIIINH